MTSQRLRIRSEARREIDEAFDWYFARSPEIARAFLDEIENSLRQVAAHAQRFPLYTANTRRRVLDRFPYSVIYSREEARVACGRCCPRQEASWLLGKA
jgi:plasmid stabilization system protein ParE